jgi:hypothetical protein
MYNLSFIRSVKRVKKDNPVTTDPKGKSGDILFYDVIEEFFAKTQALTRFRQEHGNPKAVGMGLNSVVR